MHKQTITNELQRRVTELEVLVTELHQENQALRQTEERFRALFEQAADYILILEPTADGIPVIVDLNEAACAIHGYSREELLGKPISFLDSAETRKNIPERACQVLAGQSQTFEAEHICKDGSTITVEVTAQTIMVAGKQYIYAIERNVSARKKNERVLRNYERIIATSKEHMSLLDHNYVYRAVNDSYLTAHNHRREDIVGHTVAEMLGQETFDSLVKEKLDRCLAGEEIRYQGWFHFVGLGRLFMDVAYYPLVEEDGSVSGVVVNARNITAQHEAEEALRQAKEELNARVEERTAELSYVNTRLEREVVEHRLSEERLRTIFQTSPDAVVISRVEDGLVLEVNEGFTQMTGYSRSDAIGYTSVDLQLWHNQEERQKMLNALTSHGFVENFELELQRRDGSLTTVLLSARYIDFEGEQQLLSVVRDIGDWKETRARLHLLSNAVEQTGEGISITSLAGTILFTNKAFAAMHSYQVEEIVGRHISVLHRAEQMPGVESALRCTVQHGEFAGEVMHARRNGSIFPGLIHFSLLRDEKDASIGIIGTLRDISELKTAEARLLESEAHYRAIVEDQTELICRFLPNGVLTFVNDAYCRYFGKTRQELVGYSFIPLILEEDQAQELANLALISPQNPIATVQRRVLFANGITRWQEWSDRGIFDDQGRIIEFQAVGRDITEQRLLEEDLRHARRAAEAASLAKSAFLANMSHEVRTPLNAIIGFAELLKDGSVGSVNSEQQDYLAEILQGGHRLLDLITDILDLSHLEVDQTQIDLGDVDLGLLLSDELETLSEMARQRQISVQMEIDKTIGTIESDERILRKVVAGLLENALKFTPPGGNVGVNLARYGDEVSVTVWDTGIGISEEQKKRLFVPFQQGDSSISKEYQGIGLGLVLCKRFLELLDGRIEVESSVNAGSRMTFFIPYLLKIKTKPAIV